MSPDRIRRAAEVLREEAECLKRSHTLDGVWPDLEMLALATELETHATEVEQTARAMSEALNSGDGSYRP